MVSANNIDPQRTHIITIPDTLHTESKQPVINESYKKHQTNNFLEKITDDSMFKFSLNSPFPTDDWGFPLSVFTKVSFLLFSSMTSIIFSNLLYR